MAVAEIAAIIERARSVFDPRRVRKDQPYRLETMIDGSVRRFEYEIDNDRFLRVTRADGGGLREYLHLSSIAVRAGARVEQGVIIGRVGATGLATGPHLDYRVKKNGAFVNPVAAHRAMPPADPVPAMQMEAFADVRDRALAALGGPSVARVAKANGTVQ